jgi:hypothetical protein
VASAVVIAGALLVVAAGNALVASQQVTLDSQNNQLSSALRNAQNLQLARADLEAPNRILSIAEARLHMVRPPTVTYLVPVNPGPDGSSTHGRGAKTPGQKAEGAATGH